MLKRIIAIVIGLLVITALLIGVAAISYKEGYDKGYQEGSNATFWYYQKRCGECGAFSF